MTPQGQPLSQLKAEHLSKTYDSRKVVDDVAVYVNTGEVVGLFGPNGAGKTTSFYMIIGFIRPDAGQIMLDGDNLTDLPMFLRARKGITYLPQEPSIFKKMSVKDNLKSIMEFREYDKIIIEHKIEEVLDAFKLAHLSGNSADLLSGGERRRLEIARAMMIAPKFMLLDEPFSGIDPISISDLKKIVLGLKKRGIGILISDHNVRDSLPICDRAYIISDGKILIKAIPSKWPGISSRAKSTLARSFTSMLELKQTQRLAQQLVLTPQLQQAIKLLQLSQLELVEAIEEEIKENPVLEVREEEPEEREEQPKKEEMLEWLERHSPSEDFMPREDKEYPDYENIVKKVSGLRDYLRRQVGLSDFSADERVFAEWIIENIDDNGYLGSTLEEVADMSGILQQSLELVLKKVQALDPAGVGARSLPECLLIQYKEKGEKDEVFEDVLVHHFELFRKMDLKEIAKRTGYSLEQIKAVFEKMKTFDPKPGRNYENDQPIYVVPDVYVVKGEEGFDVFLNDDNVPDLKLSGYYLDLFVREKLNGDTKEYIRKKIKQAEWFMKSLQQRQKTLYLVAKSIVDFQGDFFEKGVRCLKPLILKDVANYVGVHESTVSRITTNKYMGTPCGVFEMKFFFTTGVGSENGDARSANAVMDYISEIVEKEDRRNPLKDEEIMVLLSKRFNIRIARRTVAKYREVLRIQSSRERRRLE